MLLLCGSVAHYLSVVLRHLLPGLARGAMLEFSCHQLSVCTLQAFCLWVPGKCYSPTVYLRRQCTDRKVHEYGFQELMTFIWCSFLLMHIFSVTIAFNEVAVIFEVSTNNFLRTLQFYFSGLKLIIYHMWFNLSVNTVVLYKYIFKLQRILNTNFKTSSSMSLRLEDA